MKVGFVFPPMWAPHSDGSLQIWNHEVTTRLSKYCDVHVYAGDSGLTPFNSHDFVDGVQYRRYSVRWDNRFLKRFEYIQKALGNRRPISATDLWYPIYALRVALDLKKQGCDIVHVYNYPQFANLIKYLNPSVRVILNMHGELLTQIEFTDLSSRLPNIDLITSCSEFIAERTRAKFPRIASRCRALLMGLSADAFSADRQEQPSPRRLLCVGRISPEKGIHVLLDAFELIIRRYPDATLTIVGPEWIAPRGDIVDLCLEKEVAAGLTPFYEGSYLSQLKQRLSPQAAQRVIFAGLVAHKDVPGFYEKADIYVSPSLYESFGMSVIEAMAAGLPVVAARVRSFQDLISNGETGLLVEAVNPSAIAEGVFQLFEDDNLRKSISRTAREIACRQYSWDTIAISLMQMYREVLDTPSVSFALKQITEDHLVAATQKARNEEIHSESNFPAEPAMAKEASSGTAPRLEEPSLSIREMAVVQLIIKGYQNKEIGGILSMSEATVENHLDDIFDKFGVSDRLELALYAIDHRLNKARRASQLVRSH